MLGTILLIGLILLLLGALPACPHSVTHESVSQVDKNDFRAEHSQVACVKSLFAKALQSGLTQLRVQATNEQMNKYTLIVF
jgi:hypothetical protein